ncbi:MAG: hypothetical protein ACOCZX_00480 [Candidatus Bipolaricaulota bacterium]
MTDCKSADRTKQELEEKIDQLESENETLKKENAFLQRELEKENEMLEPYRPDKSKGHLNLFKRLIHSLYC